MSWAFGSVYGSRIALPVGIIGGRGETAAGVKYIALRGVSFGEKLATARISGFMAVGTRRYSVLLSRH